MTEPTSSGWFSELAPDQGSAFSLKLNAASSADALTSCGFEIHASEQWGKLLIVDGQCRLSERDAFIYHEMLAHIALFAHPAPRKAAVIGGNDGGLLQEIFKHADVNDITWLQDNSELGSAWSGSDAVADPRLQIVSAGPQAWLESLEPGSLDLLWIDPLAVLAILDNGLLQAAVAALSDEGVLVLPSGSPLFHAEPVIEALYWQLGAMGADNRHLVTFPLPSRPGGWWSCLLASKSLDVTSFRIEEAATKEFASRYYNAEMHAAALGIPEFLRQLLQLDE